MTALVFNCDYNGLSIIQELGRHGVQVLALDSTRSIGTYSRYAKFYQCPNPIIAEQEFIQYLLDLGPTFETKPVLFPTNDEWAMAISRHKIHLLEHYVPCVADWSVVAPLIHKQDFYKWALSKGYPVPKCWTAKEISLIPDNVFPIAAKPEYRRTSSNTQSSIQISKQLDQLRLTVFRNQQQLDKFVRTNHLLLEYFLFLEYIEGLADRMYTIGIYANKEHKILGLFMGRKVRGFPPDIGDCVLGQVEEMPQWLKDMVQKMVLEIGYHGIAEFEFKRDAITGEFKLIEINPRSWSWIGITPACNVSLPWIAYTDLTGVEPISYTESQMPTGSVKRVRLLQDLSNCLFKNRRAGYPKLHMTFREWWKSLRCEQLMIAEFSKDDLYPGLFSLYEFLKIVIFHALGLKNRNK